jgi:3-oxoacyl-[acyl-carrier protein] reductase
LSEGRVALVTGGSRGIGRAIVEALARDGFQVAFTYRQDAAGAESLQASLAGRARAYPLDLLDHARPQALVEQVEQEFGELFGLVNNAGLRKDALLAMTPDSDWEAVLDVNLGGVFRCCRAALPRMLSRRRGAIVNVSSLSALRGLPGQAAYAGAKAGIVGLTRSLAREVGKRGVRVNAVLPGFVASELTAGLPEDKIALLRATECLPSGTRAEDVADAVGFLLSDKAAAITGQAVCVDAGSSA